MNTNAELSPRETEVAWYLAWGAAKKQIAFKLRISVNTVKNIAQSVYDKTGVQSVGELSSWWFVVKHGVSLAARPILSVFFLITMISNEAADFKNTVLISRTELSMRYRRKGKDNALISI